jgi:hypothetical protein
MAGPQAKSLLHSSQLIPKALSYTAPISHFYRR